jgi:hypothetical protein
MAKADFKTLVDTLAAMQMALAEPDQKKDAK